jgi:hypothetical protein
VHVAEFIDFLHHLFKMMEVMPLIAHLSGSGVLSLIQLGFALVESGLPLIFGGKVSL